MSNPNKFVGEERNGSVDYVKEIRDKYFPKFNHTPDMIARDKFTIAHGIRNLVICGYIDLDPAIMSKMHMMLDLTPAYGCGGTCVNPITFVIEDKGRGCGVCGFASHPWIIESLEWLHSHVDGGEHPDRLTGFLLGYHPDAVEENERAYSGLRHPQPTTKT